MSFDDQVSEHIRQRLQAYDDVIDMLCAMAVSLQAPGMLHRLRVIDQWGHHRAVASALA